MTLATRFLDLGSRLLIKFGNAGVIKDPTTDTYDEATGSVTRVDDDVDVVVAPPQGVSQKLVDGTNVLESDLTTIITAKNFTVNIVPGTHRLVTGGKTYEIVEITAVSAQDTDIVYNLRIR